MTALPPRTCRPSTLENEPRNGRFLGYARTTRNAIYLDVETGTIKTCKDVAFNEAAKGYDDLTPNEKLLQLEGASNDNDIIEARNLKSDLFVTDSTWISTKRMKVYMKPVGSEDPIGIKYELCDDRNQPFITAITLRFVNL